VKNDPVWQHHIFVVTMHIAAVAWLVWLLLLLAVIALKKSSHAFFPAILAILAGFVGTLMPALWMGRDNDIVAFLCSLLPGCALCVLPFFLVVRKQGREIKAEKQAEAEAAERARQARQDHAERVLRSFGA